MSPRAPRSTLFPYTTLFRSIIVVGGINLFIDLTESMHSDGLVTYDSKITEFVTSFRNPNLTPFMQAITHVGDIYGYMVLTVICTISFYLIFKNSSEDRRVVK